MIIKINDNNGYVITDCHANGSVSFMGDIPEGAIVKGVKVDGKYLDDYIECCVAYPRTVKDGEFRVVAVLKNAVYTSIYGKASASEVTEFEVEYEMPGVSG